MPDLAQLVLSCLVLSVCLSVCPPFHNPLKSWQSHHPRFPTAVAHIAHRHRTAWPDCPPNPASRSGHRLSQVIFFPSRGFCTPLPPRGRHCLIWTAVVCVSGGASGVEASRWDLTLRRIDGWTCNLRRMGYGRDGWEGLGPWGMVEEYGWDARRCCAHWAHLQITCHRPPPRLPSASPISEG
ncbi:hypothetical protein K505DRAFT_126088 [Melanomma pulvis-pyrius CBS 109.77]|uniref:Secreted protein n=1 Tax=Melanomma pulvis-pyrius CBS 109.77 TaxID=1314802 RepID=A0A6A6XNJ0_9PLEO|nr:hypothetical protein K505DRAFT_126088 [Melanomma pulvis-pyrius CBS 109.77]